MINHICSQTSSFSQKIHVSHIRLYVILIITKLLRTYSIMYKNRILLLNNSSKDVCLQVIPTNSKKPQTSTAHPFNHGYVTYIYHTTSSSKCKQLTSTQKKKGEKKKLKIIIKDKINIRKDQDKQNIELQIP